MPVLQRIEEGKYRASKRLMDHVAKVIQGLPQYVLLDEQLVVHSKVLALAKSGFHDAKKTVLIVRGGPGTGKSVIALNLMSSLLAEGFNSHYATGSKAFTETLRKMVGSRSQVQFKYFNSYVEAQPNEIDVLICDESHRIRTTSVDRFTPKSRRSGLPQVEELIHASKVSVYFVDDRQVVRPGEIGSTDYIRSSAASLGCRVLEYELHAQFRCAGSDQFVEWVNNTLGIEKTPSSILQTEEGFEFGICESPEELDQLIRSKVQAGATARLTAGFCWPWSKPDKNGQLENDVTIDGFARPWNARPDAGKLAPGIPKSNLWAHDPGGLFQIGCVYTAQGFEFDFVGVIFGKDLTYDLDRQVWEGHPEVSQDTKVKRAKGEFLALVKNTYRVLLSRGLKGCFVYFEDKDTERFFRSRIGTPLAFPGRADEAEATSPPESRPARSLPFERVAAEALRPFENAIPVFDLRAAAGGFSEFQALIQAAEDGEVSEAIDWVALPEDFPARPGRFLIQVVGESMNRRIPNGSWCLFREAPAGSRAGKVVLVELREGSDPESGGRYTVKLYRSDKGAAEDGSWQHERIVLSPDSDRGGYEAIVLEPEAPEVVRVVGEFVAVVGI
ncbi:MAG: DNA/RNA helicase domain-containing protein [Thermoanaerobaculia bacterium]